MIVNRAQLVCTMIFFGFSWASPVPRHVQVESALDALLSTLDSQVQSTLKSAHSSFSSLAKRDRDHSVDHHLNYLRGDLNIGFRPLARDILNAHLETFGKQDSDISDAVSATSKDLSGAWAAHASSRLQLYVDKHWPSSHLERRMNDANPVSQEDFMKHLINVFSTADDEPLPPSEAPKTSFEPKRYTYDWLEEQLRNPLEDSDVFERVEAEMQKADAEREAARLAKAADATAQKKAPAVAKVIIDDEGVIRRLPLDSPSAAPRASAAKARAKVPSKSTGKSLPKKKTAWEEQFSSPLDEGSLDDILKMTPEETAARLFSKKQPQQSRSQPTIPEEIEPVGETSGREDGISELVDRLNTKLKSTEELAEEYQKSIQDVGEEWAPKKIPSMTGMEHLGNEDGQIGKTESANSIADLILDKPKSVTFAPEVDAAEAARAAAQQASTSTSHHVAPLDTPKIREMERGRFDPKYATKEDFLRGLNVKIPSYGDKFGYFGYRKSQPAPKPIARVTPPQAPQVRKVSPQAPQVPKATPEAPKVDAPIAAPKMEAPIEPAIIQEDSSIVHESPATVESSPHIKAPSSGLEVTPAASTVTEIQKVLESSSVQKSGHGIGSLIKGFASNTGKAVTSTIKWVVIKPAQFSFEKAAVPILTPVFRALRRA